MLGKPLQQSENGNTCVQSSYPDKIKRCDDPQLIKRWSQTYFELSRADLGNSMGIILKHFLILHLRKQQTYQYILLYNQKLSEALLLRVMYHHTSKSPKCVFSLIF
jgi:hypothetical protein